MNIFTQLASVTATFDTFGIFNEFIFPIATNPATIFTKSRSLLSNDSDDANDADLDNFDHEDDDEEEDAEIRMYNDAMRALQFLTIFSLFAISYCSLAYYIYNKPHDGPYGVSCVSKIRKLPILGWFFRQPKKVQAQDTERKNLIGNDNDSEDDDLELGKNTKNIATSEISELENSHESSSSLHNQKIGKDSNKSSTTNNSTQQTNTGYKAPLFFGSEKITILICVIGLLIFYLLWGFMQERIMSHPYGDREDESNWFKNSEFCVFINRFFGLIVSSFALKYVGPSGNDAPPFVISLCALSNMCSSWFQYESLHFVTFPVQTIFKSSKILITMGVGKIVQKKSFTIQKYLNAFAVAVGVYVFLDGQREGSKEDQDLGQYFYLGLALITGYALCDAFTSNWQQKIFEQTKISSLEMMRSVNAFTFAVSFVFCLTDLYNIFEFYVTHPLIGWHTLIMGLCAGFGQLLIFYTIQQFGAVLFATVMTTRMVISVLISIWYYGHTMSFQGIIGMTITFIALFKQAFDKRKPRNVSAKK